MSRADLIGLAHCSLVEARRHAPSSLLDQAPLCIMIERLEARTWR